jgi:hypothetical protein
MRRGHALGVEGFAVGGGPPLKPGTIPAGPAHFVVENFGVLIDDNLGLRPEGW